MLLRCKWTLCPLREAVIVPLQPLCWFCFATILLVLLWLWSGYLWSLPYCRNSFYMGRHLQCQHSESLAVKDGSILLPPSLWFLYQPALHLFVIFWAAFLGYLSLLFIYVLSSHMCYSLQAMHYPSALTLHCILFHPVSFLSGCSVSALALLHS